MAVDTLHPEYIGRKTDWETIRNCLAGQRNIKAKGAKYLPKSAAQQEIEKKFGVGEDSGPYGLYKDGARFPDILDETKQGFVGLATRKAWEINGLPSSMDYLVKNAGNGLPLIDWQGLLLSEGLGMGRYAMFPDVPEEGKLPEIAWYQTESTINWKLVNGFPSLVVFKEGVEKEDVDMFSHDEQEQHRVIRMDGNQCFVDVHSETGAVLKEGIELKHHEGYCPVVIGGAVNNDWLVDKPPLLGVAECALAYYKLSAQQRWAIRASCDPMFLALGFSPNEIQIWGGGSVFEKDVKPGEAAIEVIEVKGDGIDKATAEMDRELQEAFRQSHMLTEKSAVESGTSLRQRTNSKTATLKSVDRCAAAAMEKALNLIAAISGISADITVTSTFEYSDDEIDAVALEKISQVAERGHMPEAAVVEYARKRGMLEAYDIDEVRAMIEEDEERRAEKAAAFFPPVIDDDEEPVDG